MKKSPMTGRNQTMPASLLARGAVAVAKNVGKKIVRRLKKDRNSIQRQKEGKSPQRVTKTEKAIMAGTLGTAATKAAIDAKK